MKLHHRPRTEQVQQQRLDQTQQLAVQFLSLPGADLAARLADLAAANRYLRLPAVPARRADPVAEAAADGPGLLAHVLERLPHLVPDPRDQAPARALVEALDPSGYLAEPPVALARASGWPEPVLRRVLGQLQQIDPPGLFAESLADCLRLQLVAAGETDPGWPALLAHLPLVAEGRLPALAAATGLDPARLPAMLARLRRLNPRPGGQFACDSAPPRLPELEAQPDPAGGWQVRLCGDASPRPALRPLPADAPAAEQARFRDAARILTAVELRNRALLAVGSEIAARQAAAFDRGPAALLPLTRRDLAAQLGLHETTVGRIVRHAAIRIGGRVQPLSDFLARPPRPGAATSAAAVTALIRARLAQSPVSDAALAQWLAGQGISVSRRRIAKYRAAAHIPAGRRHGPAPDC